MLDASTFVVSARRSGPARLVVDGHRDLRSQQLPRKDDGWPSRSALPAAALAAGLGCRASFQPLRPRRKAASPVLAKPKDAERSAFPQWPVFLVPFLHLLGFTMGGPILPALRSHFNLAPSQMGQVTSMFPLGMSIAVWVFPALSDTLGRKPILAFCLSFVGLGFIMQGLSIRWGWSFHCFLVLRFLSGIVAGGSTVLKAYIADVTERAALPRAMAYREAAGTLSYIVGPTLGGVLFVLFGLPGVVIFSGLTSLMAACSILAFPRSGRGKGEAKATSTGAAPVATNLTWPKGGRTSAAIMILLHFLYNFGQSFFDSFFAIFCVEMDPSLTPAILGFGLTLIACFVFLNSVFVYPKLVDASKLASDVAFYGLVSICLGLVSIGVSPTWWGVAAAVLFYGIGVPIFTPSVPTVLAQCAPRKRRGFILGVDSAVSATARFISPAVMGWVYQLGTKQAFYTAGAIVALGAVIAILSRGHLRRTLSC